MRIIITPFLFSFFYSISVIAQLALQPFVIGLNQPVDIANAGDGTNRLFIVERAGVIKVVSAQGDLQSTPFLDIREKVDRSGGEEGLLGLVFHPEYQSNGYFFIYFIQTISNVRQGVLERYTVSSDPQIGDLNSASEVMRIDQPQENHNGGDMAFGPQGNLFLGLGDGGSGNDPGERSQNLTLPLGKMLRINVDKLPYTIPADNPFVHSTGDTLKEIWAWGLRNPWRFSFDTNYDLWIGDVGQSAREEINFIPAAQNIAGLNYGWDCREGDIECPGCGNNHCAGLSFTEPVYWYGPGPGLSVTGGYVLRGDYYNEFEGRYIFADYVRNEIRTLQTNGSQSVSVSGPISANKISTFGIDEVGRVYAANYSGTIFQVVETGVLPIELIAVRLERHQKTILLDWETGMEFNFSHFEVERSRGDEPFVQIGIVPAQGQGTPVTSYQYTDDALLPGSYIYRLKSIDLDGSFTYSMTLQTEIENDAQITILPNPATNRINIYFSGSNDSGTLQIIGLDGTVLKQMPVEMVDGISLEINTGDLERGLQMVRYIDSKGQKTTRKLMLY